MTTTDLHGAYASASMQASSLGARMEQTIRDLAGSVVNENVTRIEHPSFGCTKTSVREAYARMEGAIGLFMVLVGQAAHAQVAGAAVFADEATTDRVRQARAVLSTITGGGSPSSIRRG